MASYIKAFPLIYPQEGYYVNDPDDSGGETYYGITRRDNPDWPGWLVVDAKPRSKGEHIPEADPYVQAFYKPRNWDVFKGDQIINQAVAEDMLVNGINQGVPETIITTKQALGITPADSVFNYETLTALNVANPYP